MVKPQSLDLWKIRPLLLRVQLFSLSFTCRSASSASASGSAETVAAAGRSILSEMDDVIRKVRA